MFRPMWPQSEGYLTEASTGRHLGKGRCTRPNFVCAASSAEPWGGATQKRWRAYLTDDLGELAFYCPACTVSGFGDE